MSRALASLLSLLLTAAACASPQVDFERARLEAVEPQTVSDLAGQCIYIMMSRTTTPAENALMESCRGYTAAFVARWPTPCPRAEIEIIDEFLMWSRANPERAEDDASAGLTATMARLGC